MPTVASFHIVLDRPDARYMPGETVTGEVLLKLNRKTHCRGFTFQAKGFSFVEWGDNAGTFLGGPNYTVHRKEESYINEISTIPVGTKGKSGLVELPPGAHQHSFAVHIPPYAPGTFQSRPFAAIRYELNATLVKCGVLEKNYKVHHMFTVTPVLDLNPTPCLLKSKSKRFYGKIRWCSCISVFASALFTVERAGYVPGECISVSAVVDTLTRGSMKVKASLIKKKTFSGYIGYDKISRKVVARQQRSVELREGDAWSGDVLEVPELYPTLDGRVITFVYVLKLKVTISAGGSTSIKIPITIGTEPFATDGEPSIAETRFAELTAPNN